MSVAMNRPDTLYEEVDVKKLELEQETVLLSTFGAPYR